MAPARKPSVCVIGAGAVGLASALELSRRGAEVTVLEARNVAGGSSGLSVGIIETQYLGALDIELRVRSMRFFDLLERKRGLRIVRNGYLRLSHDEGSLADFERSVLVQRDLGIGDATVLDSEQVARLVPDMRVDDVCFGLFGASDGYVDGHLYCGLLAELAGGAGAKIVQGCALLGAERLAAGGLLLSTSEGSLRCEVAVDAAGPWAGSVARLLGHRLELIPQRHQACAVHLPHELDYTMPSVMDYAPGGGEAGLYFRDDGARRLIAGLHAEGASAPPADPDSYAHGADEWFVEELARRLVARLPSLGQARVAGGWAGLYPSSAGGMPFVGPLAGDANVIAVGGAGSGIQLSPVLAELVADWALAGEPRVLARADELVPDGSGAV